MAKKKYRVGIIGCGGTSGHFIEGFGAWPDLAELAALCDVAPAQFERRQEDYADICGKAATYTDYHKMLDEADLDIVCVCSYSDKHLEHTSDCFAAGKHVFVEKPVGYNLEEARRFRYMADKYPDLKCAVAYSLRYYKAFMDLKALIEAGTLGTITSCEISYSHGHHRGGARRREERNRDESDAGGRAQTRGGTERRRRPMPRKGRYEDRGGNYISSAELTGATHPWDLARYLLGEAREVFCTRSGVSMGILWMESGALCHVLAGSVRRAAGGYMQQQIVQAHGTEGSAWLTRDKTEPYEWRCHYKTDGDIEVAPHVSDLPESSHGAALRSKNLIDAIEGKAELICSMVDGAKTSELLHALWLSLRTHSRVPVLPGNKSG